MKKVTLLLVAIATLFSTISCETEKPGPGPAPEGSPALTIVAPKEVQVEKSAVITFSIAENAAADITINIATANADIIEVAASAVIKSGTKSITASLKGLKIGNAELSFASTGATIASPKATVEVKAEPVKLPEYDYPYMQYYTYVGISKVTVGETVLESTCGDSDAGADGILAGNNDFYDEYGTACVNDNFTAKVAKVATGTTFEILYDPFTSTKGDENYQVVFFIDWNGDTVFGDTPEEIIVKDLECKGDTAKTLSGTITVPAGAVESARCRVIVGKFVDSSPGEIMKGDESLGNGYFMDFNFTTK